MSLIAKDFNNWKKLSLHFD